MTNPLIETGPPADSGGPGVPLDPGSSTTPRPAAAWRRALEALIKGIGLALGLAVAILPATTCWTEAWLRSGRDEFFLLWGQAFALVPGLPGKYLRRCFYALTLRSCSLSCDLGFMTYVNDPRAEIGRRVYIGGWCGVGLIRIGDGCLIGSRVSLLSGSRQHTRGPDGRLTPFDRSQARQVRLGEETWIGEGAIIMADVGCRCVIGAGSVVSQPVPDGCLVAGNPARFIRRVGEDRSDAALPAKGQQP